MEEKSPIWSVSEVNRSVREVLEGAFGNFWVGGEVGSLLIHRSGHVYFTLKDATSQLRACWFGGAAEARKLGMENGSLVETFGRLSVYEVRGEYQFNVRQLRPAGLGMLQRRFEELKKKLAAEGLFDAERKKPIPMLPEHIGVVTSPSGAAIRDFLQIIDRRFPNVRVSIFPCQVQGATAAREVASGVEFFNRRTRCDVIVVMRGGGSMEDLWPFNEEIVARAVAASEIPVISAVGHEIDFTICDFAADLRVPTPSAAAELVIGRRAELTEKMGHLQKELTFALESGLTAAEHRLHRAANSFAFREPQRIVEQKIRQLDELELRLSAAATDGQHRGRNRFDTAALRFENAVRNEQNRLTTGLEHLETTLRVLDPRRELERGFSMVFDPDSGKLVTTSVQKSGKHLEIHFADGKLPVSAD